MGSGTTLYGVHSADMIRCELNIQKLDTYWESDPRSRNWPIKHPRSWDRPIILYSTEDGRHVVAVTAVGTPPDAGLLWKDIVSYGPVGRYLWSLDGVPSLKPMAFAIDQAPRSVSELTPERISEAELLAEELINDYRTESGQTPKGP